MSDKNIFYNDKPFYMLVIESNNFDFNKLDWNSPDYCQVVSSQPFIKTLQVTTNTFFPKIKELLNVDEKNLLVTDVIAEEPEYNYELIFIDTLNKKSDLPFNNLATVLNINGEMVRGDAILIRNHIPTLTTDYSITNMTSSDLYKLLSSRAVNKVVVWDETWRDSELYGDINVYAEKFFEEEKYKKFEIGFLKHNLNIWYVESEYGEPNLCGKLLNCKIEKLLIFTMLTNEIRGNITKSETDKIFKLSTVLESPYAVDSKWNEDEKDAYDRTIIKNKYRVLDCVYKSHFP